MLKGRVVWFNAAKGYGFLRTEDGKEVFTHYTAIIADGYKNLYEGDEVEFEVVAGQKGPQADQVRVLKRAARRAGNSRDASQEADSGN